MQGTTNQRGRTTVGRRSWRASNVVLGLVLLVLAAAAPARAGSAATAEYARQVSTAQVRLAELEALITEAELRIRQLEQSIREQGKSQAQRLENIDQVNTEVTRLRGEIEVLQFKVT